MVIHTPACSSMVMRVQVQEEVIGESFRLLQLVLGKLTGFPPGPAKQPVFVPEKHSGAQTSGLA